MQAPDGWVYFVSDYVMKKVKIGRAVNPIQRVKAINSQHPDGDLWLLAAIPFADHKAAEERLHRRFFKHLLRNEWFTLHDDIYAYIDEESCGVITLHDLLIECAEPIPISNLSLSDVCHDPIFVLMFSSDRSHFDHAHLEDGEAEDCYYCNPHGEPDATRQDTVA